MKKYIRAAEALLAFALLILAIVGCGGRSTPSPTHVTAVFVDGINYGDLRQACSQMTVQAGGSLPSCEAHFAMIEAQAAFYTGKLYGYKVVPHSAKVWTQDYRGHDVELAVVKFIYGPTGGQPFTAHLRKHDGRWQIWYIT